jgi:ribonuclease HII
MRKKNSPFIYKNQYETAAWAEDGVVCGIDEVGRGCLAGPLVTAAVILPVNKTSPMLKDSKLISLQQRQTAFCWIQKHCWFSVGLVHNRFVDHHNIYQATLITMKKALVTLLATCPLRPNAILVDAMPLSIQDTQYKDIPVYAFCQGEQKSNSIAAASIVAKITRDLIMDRLDLIIPGYHFNAHKGYATKAHQQAISALSPCVLHRASFLGNMRLKENDAECQQTIC